MAEPCCYFIPCQEIGICDECGCHINNHKDGPERTLRMLVINKPNRNAMDGMKFRAEKLLLFNVISKVPNFTCEPCSTNVSEEKSLWVIVASNVPHCDVKVWLGFTECLDFCRNNRYVTVGSDEQ